MTAQEMADLRIAGYKKFGYYIHGLYCVREFLQSLLDKDLSPNMRMDTELKLININWKLSKIACKLGVES